MDTLAQRIEAAKIAIEHRLYALEAHIGRHEAWRELLEEAQMIIIERSASDGRTPRPTRPDGTPAPKGLDAEEKRTQTALLDLLTARIDELRYEEERVRKERNILHRACRASPNGPASDLEAVRIATRWTHVAPRRATRPREEDSIRDVITETHANLNQEPLSERCARWGLRGVAASGLLSLFVSFGGSHSVAQPIATLAFDDASSGAVLHIVPGVAVDLFKQSEFIRL